ncbi:unnamed protein product [Thelazia callipaeda]|uniref:Uncharacterized protein n=1 Tax=Thelazia callipaeda TaxID=103827 RepID=A0A0N5CR65_THECL|nr:unnamed protein product [Thelazia callipaeda]
MLPFWCYDRSNLSDYPLIHFTPKFRHLPNSQNFIKELSDLESSTPNASEKFSSVPSESLHHHIRQLNVVDLWSECSGNNQIDFKCRRGKLVDLANHEYFTLQGSEEAFEGSSSSFYFTIKSNFDFRNMFNCIFSILKMTTSSEKIFCMFFREDCKKCIKNSLHTMQFTLKIWCS